jgi:hypothetical protein
MTYCAVWPGGHRPDDGGNEHLWNVGKLLPDYTAQQPTTVTFVLAAVRTWNITSTSYVEHERICVQAEQRDLKSSGDEKGHKMFTE